MSLIEYIEPTSMGDFFAGIAVLLFFGVFTYIIYRGYIKLIQYVDMIINKEAKYEIIEEIYLDEIAKEKGIDLDSELVKKKMLNDMNSKNFRKRLEADIYSKMFNEDLNKNKK